MANQLLQQCATGPEIDQIWNAFQINTDSGVSDDEENEARLVHLIDDT